MGKKGWWRQLQSDNYPETQKSYGQDLKALEGYRGKGPPPDREIEVLKLQDRCPKCGNLFWIDKGCTFCKVSTKTDQKLRSRNFEGETYVKKSRRPLKSNYQNSIQKDKINYKITLYDYQHFGSTFEIKCKNCGHKGKISIESLAKRFGPSTKIGGIKNKFCCRICSSKSYSLFLL